ncbi:hypothetical protein [uncultured Pontibacter sp.]|uniref:hypothetical protein n=1 Tax=uncultured Pontibacter sp. TaxID=453356 RepID=UPI00262D7CE7|nr:hypothetical protein [uncultured Pontibacter sp.]
MLERLPFRSQQEALHKGGTLIAQRKFNEYTVTLYTLGNIFVEVWRGSEAEVVSTFKRTSNAMAVLAPYVDNIDLQDMIGSDM